MPVDTVTSIPALRERAHPFNVFVFLQGGVWHPGLSEAFKSNAI